MEKFKKGDVVYHNSIKFNEYELDTNTVEHLTTGKVKKIDEDRYVINWASPEHLKKFGAKAYTTKEFESNLLSKQEAKEKLSSLEKEFKYLTNKIEEQMKIAAEALRMAADLCKANKKELYFLADHASEFIAVADDIGWNTSSLFC